MSLLHRRLLYCLFFLIFFISAPIVILLAEGYHYNFGKHRLEKTGVLFLESKPNKAEIYLNGELQKDKTEARLKNLLPEEYEVTLKKDGYVPWQKKLTVRAGETTFAQYVRLFKAEPLMANILPAEILSLSKAENNLVAVAYKEKEVIKVALLNLQTNFLNQLAELNFVPGELVISPRQNYLLVTDKKQYLVIDLVNKKIIELNKLIAKINLINWTNTDKDEMLYFSNEQGLFKINLSSKNILAVIESNGLLDWQFRDTDLYWLKKETKNVSLYKTKLSQPNNQVLLVALPLSTYNFVAAPNDYIFSLDKQNNIFYLINLNEVKEKMKVFTEVQYVKWFENSLEILLGNNFEISRYNLEEKEEYIILRLSSEIKEASWYPISTHICYLVADGLKIIETTARDKIMQSLISRPNISQFFTDTNGQKIYYVDDNGLNVAEIQ